MYIYVCSWSLALLWFLFFYLSISLSYIFFLFHSHRLPSPLTIAIVIVHSPSTTLHANIGDIPTSMTFHNPRRPRSPFNRCAEHKNVICNDTTNRYMPVHQGDALNQFGEIVCGGNPSSSKHKRNVQHANMYTCPGPQSTTYPKAHRWGNRNALGEFLFFSLLSVSNDILSNSTIE